MLAIKVLMLIISVTQKRSIDEVTKSYVIRHATDESSRVVSSILFTNWFTLYYIVISLFTKN